jgi:probable rRNA maturation factor
MAVAVVNRQRRVKVPVARLRRVATTALRALGRPGMDVHLTFVGDRAARRLNARYRGVPAPTDVLAFPLQAPGPSTLLGEVIVSAETARRQARRLGVPTGLELGLLVVHGLLHLVGYDDRDPGEARLMHLRAREILRAVAGPVPEKLWAGLLTAR